MKAGENDAHKKPAQDQAVAAASKKLADSVALSAEAGKRVQAEVKPASKKLADSVAVSAAEAGKRVQADC